MRHAVPSTAGLTQASSVARVVRSSDALSGTDTMSFTPSKLSADPNLPVVVRVAPEMVPVLPLPEESAVVVPPASSKPQAPTRFAAGAHTTSE